LEEIELIRMMIKEPNKSRAKGAARPSDLPDFSLPPVNEVILSLQFATLEKLRSYHIGLLWSEFKAEYPDISEQQPISAAFETFGTVWPAPGSVDTRLS
jgi:hypothetical protein